MFSFWKSTIAKEPAVTSALIGHTVVELVDGDSEGVFIEELQSQGAYFLLIADQDAGGACTTFAVAGTEGRGGSVSTLTRLPGKHGGHLTVHLLSGEKPRLRYMHQPQNTEPSTRRRYNVTWIRA